jgi:hypothetical protein
MIKRYKIKSRRIGDLAATTALRPATPPIRDALAYAAVLKIIG